MMTAAYAFSIVIPTRNRADTLIYTLETCLEQIGFDDYEIVINDNGDDERTKEVIQTLIKHRSFGDGKINYLKRETVCCMAENFEQAIGRASGDYIIVLGDDDGILPMALQELQKIIAKTGASIIKWRNGLYNWPEIKLANSANYLGFSLSRSIEKLVGRIALATALERLNYENLPMLYINSAIRRDVIESIKDNEGRLFRSQSPDVYSAFVLAYKCSEYISTTIPFTLAGLSHHSNGVATSFDGSNPTPRLDFSALNQKAGIYHHPSVPDLPIFPIVALADSFYHAKARHFEADDTVALSRRTVMQECVNGADTDDGDVRQKLLNACLDDAELTELTLGLINANRKLVKLPRLKPEHLGFDGTNLHLDPREFGVKNIAQAVRLVHKIVWPGEAPLRFDVPIFGELLTNLEATLIERSGSLETALAELVSLRETLVDRTAELCRVREILADRTMRLEATLIERSGSLETALAELVSLRETLVDRTAELCRVREALADRTVRLEAAIAERGNFEC